MENKTKRKLLSDFDWRLQLWASSEIDRSFSPVFWIVAVTDSLTGEFRIRYFGDRERAVEFARGFDNPNIREAVISDYELS